MMRNQFVEWDKYLLDNTWASAAASTTIPENCIAIYHVLNPALKQIVDTLYVVSWSTQYNQDFKELSLAWVQESFEVEESDIKQVETPEESILQPGGQIFFLLDQNKHMVGTIAMMISDHGECELGKLTVKKEYNGKGYAHPLMREGIAWAREKKQPNILLLCNTKLEKAITLYKGYGFETIHLGPHPDYARCNIVMKLTL
jgi:ribosomal protein S18 acetylase RimI-like enzyme